MIGCGVVKLPSGWLPTKMPRAAAFGDSVQSCKVSGMEPLFLKIDCHSLPVPDLEAGILFYTSLGHELICRDSIAAGLRLPDSNAELVLHTDERPIETDFSVESVPDAVEQFVKAGGNLVDDEGNVTGNVTPVNGG